MREVRLAAGSNVEDIHDAPLIALEGTRLEVDGQYVGDIPASDGIPDLPDLERALRERRDSWAMIQPHEPVAREVLIMIDREVPSRIVKGVMRAAGAAGFTGFSFMVNRRS